MAGRVLITGAGGFVGRTLVPALAKQGWDVREAARSPRPGAVAVGDIDGTTDWHAALEGCDAVVHLAARVHDGRRAAAGDFDAFRRTNCDATLRLAEQAAERGIRRFVFISTIKVNGEGRYAPYTADDTPAPQGAYAIAKHEAEQGLGAIATRTGLEVVILRPPLVYGPGVENFASAIGLVLTHPRAAGKTWLVSDQHDLSTPDLIRSIATVLGKRARLLPLPPILLRTGALLAGRQRMYDQLAGSLTLDSAPLTRELGWSPPLTVLQQLAAMA